jgi:hypothetical protein
MIDYPSDDSNKQPKLSLRNNARYHGKKTKCYMEYPVSPNISLYPSLVMPIFQPILSYNVLFHCVLTKLYSLLSRRNEVRSSCIGPTHITLRVYALFHLQDGAANIVDVVVVALLGDKGFEGHDLAA